MLRKLLSAKSLTVTLLSPPFSSELRRRVPRVSVLCVCIWLCNLLRACIFGHSWRGEAGKLRDGDEGKGEGVAFDVASEVANQSAERPQLARDFGGGQC